MITPSLLRTFIAVVENKSFTRAGTELFRSQSAVSMQVRKLEDDLGVPLFVRDAKTVELTGQGRVLLGYAKRILRLIDEAESAVVSDGARRPIRLGCVEDYAARVVPLILVELLRDDPTAQVSTTIAEPAELRSQLGRDVDLILTNCATNAEIAGEVLRTERLVWAGSATNPEAARERPVPLALRPEDCLGCQYARSALDAAGVPWHVAYQTSGIGPLQVAVEDGLAVGVFKQSLIGGDLRVLGAQDGFPDLPSLLIVMEVAKASAEVPRVQDFAARLARHLARTE